MDPSQPNQSTPAPESESTPKSQDVPDASVADPETEKLVDDIMKSDGDEVLKAQDDATEKATVMKQGKRERFKNVWRSWWANPKKRWGTIGVIVILVGLVFGLPLTRYNVLGLVLKGQVDVQVIDSKTGDPVSGATVSLAGQETESDAEGKATLKVHLGSKKLEVTKGYYKGYTHGELVAFSGNSYKATLVALGRQVTVKVVDKVTTKPVVGATVTAGVASAKTNGNGTATIIVPSDSNTQSAKVSVNGYNTAIVSITSAGPVAKNTFSVTPAGKLYFLSNLSGKIDVVKTNLDGSDRKVVLAGTGNEDPTSTSLLASRDWKYLALLSKRSGDNASVYLIDTTNGDKLTTVDEGNAAFTFVGWSGDHFIYKVQRNTVADWQSNQSALKSLDATTGEAISLAQTQGSGTNQSDFAKQVFGDPYLIGDQVVYPIGWSGSYSDTSALDSKTAELDVIGADGSGHKVLKTFGLAAGNESSNISIVPRLYEPDGMYIQFYDGTQNEYYKYDDGTVSTDTALNDTNFYQTPYSTYLLSPSGNQTFWSEERDGKNALFVGDQDGKNQKQIASLSPYDTYGWYTDKYILVSHDSSELYIMPVSGSSAPLKITDYYKPDITYLGYGGGYGGL